MTELKPNAAKFMKKNPTLIGTVAGVKFYEHPVYGDEHPLLAITKEGKLKHTGCYELPQIGYDFPEELL